MSKSSPIEVWCPACRTSFAPETRRCVHCGGQLARGRTLSAQSSDTNAAMVASGAAPAQAAPAGGPTGPFPAEEEDLEALTKGRSPVWIVIAVLIMLASMLRKCLGS